MLPNDTTTDQTALNEVFADLPKEEMTLLGEIERHAADAKSARYAVFAVPDESAHDADLDRANFCLI